MEEVVFLLLSSVPAFLAYLNFGGEIILKNEEIIHIFLGRSSPTVMAMIFISRTIFVYQSASIENRFYIAC